MSKEVKKNINILPYALTSYWKTTWKKMLVRGKSKHISEEISV